MPSRSQRDSLTTDMLSWTAKARGVEIGLRQIKRMNLSVSMDSVSMQNGTSALMNDTPRIRSEDTNFLTASLKAFIDAVCLRRTPEPTNTATSKSKTRLPNWSAQYEISHGLTRILTDLTIQLS